MSDLPSNNDLRKAHRRRPRVARGVKPNRREEARLRKAIQALWKDVLLPASDQIRQMIKEGAAPAQIARFIEESIWFANTSYGRVVDDMVARWKMAVDRDVRNAIFRAQQSAMALDLSAVLANPDVSDAMALAGAQAANLIRTIPQRYLGDVAKAVADNFSGTPLPDGRTLLQQIQHIGGVSYRRAKLISRDQTSKLTAALNQTRQQAIGIDTYYWRAVMDERTVGNPHGWSPDGNSKHGDHWDLDGKLCRWDDPTVYSDDGGATWKKRPKKWGHSHPGVEIQCRCWADPVIDPERILAFVEGA